MPAGQFCDNKYFRVDHVDAAVWDWVRDLLLNPEALRENMEAQQAKRERANKPLYDRLAVIDDLLTNNRRQLEKLLDLYLFTFLPTASTRPAGEAEQALELSNCVLSHSASTPEAKDRAGQLRVEPEARLAPEQIAVARGRAQTKTFNALMAERRDHYTLKT